MTRVPTGRSSRRKFSPETRMRGAESVSVVTTCSRLCGRVRGRMARMGSLGGLIEIEHRPVVAAGDRSETKIGVHGGRMTDDGEHREVGEAVRVRPRRAEIERVLARV